MCPKIIWNVPGFSIAFQKVLFALCTLRGIQISEIQFLILFSEPNPFAHQEALAVKWV